MSRIEEWERQSRLSVPADLKLLWSTVGGGDLFESETILQPFGAAEDNLVVPVSQMFRSSSFDEDNFIFHKGLCISSFRRSSTLLSHERFVGPKTYC
jgi:hypothetical protein